MQDASLDPTLPRRITVTLRPEEALRLRKAACAELRRPQDQAVILIRRGLGLPGEGGEHAASA